MNRNEQFAQHMITNEPLDNAVDWIQDNLNPDDVFSQQSLLDWAGENLEGVSETKLVSHVSSTFNPEEVFDRHDLETWAEENGYVKE